jgi:hypothetical protein
VETSSGLLRGVREGKALGGERDMVVGKVSLLRRQSVWLKVVRMLWRSRPSQGVGQVRVLVRA